MSMNVAYILELSNDIAGICHVVLIRLMQADSNLRRKCSPLKIVLQVFCNNNGFTIRAVSKTSGNVSVILIHDTVQATLSLN